MVKIIEIAATMIIVLLGDKIGEYYKSDLIELHLLNGNVKYIKINKVNDYSCPKSCKTKHFHDTVVSGIINSKINYNLVYNKEQNSKISLNGIHIVNAFDIIEKKKNKKNKISKVERNKLNLKNFINKYD